jgi:hypothetical protein
MADHGFQRRACSGSRHGYKWFDHDNIIYLALAACKDLRWLSQVNEK